MDESMEAASRRLSHSDCPVDTKGDCTVPGDDEIQDGHDTTFREDAQRTPCDNHNNDTKGNGSNGAFPLTQLSCEVSTNTVRKDGNDGNGTERGGNQDKANEEKLGGTSCPLPDRFMDDDSESNSVEKAEASGDKDGEVKERERRWSRSSHGKRQSRTLRKSIALKSISSSNISFASELELLREDLGTPTSSRGTSVRGTPRVGEPENAAEEMSMKNKLPLSPMVNPLSPRTEMLSRSPNLNIRNLFEGDHSSRNQSKYWNTRSLRRQSLVTNINMSNSWGGVGDHGVLDENSTDSESKITLSEEQKDHLADVPEIEPMKEGRRNTAADEDANAATRVRLMSIPEGMSIPKKRVRRGTVQPENDPHPENTVMAPFVNAALSNLVLPFTTKCDEALAQEKDTRFYIGECMVVMTKVDGLKASSRYFKDNPNALTDLWKKTVLELIHIGNVCNLDFMDINDGIICSAILIEDRDQLSRSISKLSDYVVKTHELSNTSEFKETGLTLRYGAVVDSLFVDVYTNATQGAYRLFGRAIERATGALDACTPGWIAVDGAIATVFTIDGIAFEPLYITSPVMSTSDMPGLFANQKKSRIARMGFCRFNTHTSGQGRKSSKRSISSKALFQCKPLALHSTTSLYDLQLKFNYLKAKFPPHHETSNVCDHVLHKIVPPLAFSNGVELTEAIVIPAIIVCTMVYTEGHSFDLIEKIVLGVTAAGEDATAKRHEIIERGGVLRFVHIIHESHVGITSAHAMALFFCQRVQRFARHNGLTLATGTCKGDVHIGAIKVDTGSPKFLVIGHKYNAAIRLAKVALARTQTVEDDDQLCFMETSLLPLVKQQGIHYKKIVIEGSPVRNQKTQNTPLSAHFAAAEESSALMISLEEDESNKKNGREQRYINDASMPSSLMGKVKKVVSMIEKEPQKPVIVNGASGSGKTLLVQAAATILHSNNNTEMMWATTGERRQREQFYPLKTFLRDFFNECSITAKNAVEVLDKLIDDPGLAASVGLLRVIVPSLSIIRKSCAVINPENHSSIIRQMIVKMILSRAKEHGLCIVFDDIQWFDVDSVMFVRDLIGAKIEGLHILITTRELEHANMFALFEGSTSAYSLISIPKLTTKEECLSVFVSTMIKISTEEIPPVSYLLPNGQPLVDRYNLEDPVHVRLGERMLKQSEGQPMPIVHTATTLAEQELVSFGANGMLVIHPTMWRTRIPTVVDQIRHRVVHLSRVSRRVIICAALLGVKFDKELLLAVMETHIAPGKPAEGVMALREAISHKLLCCDPVTEEYSFPHVLILDAIKGLLLPDTCEEYYTIMFDTLIREIDSGRRACDNQTYVELLMLAEGMGSRNSCPLAHVLWNYGMYCARHRFMINARRLLSDLLLQLERPMNSTPLRPDLYWTTTVWNTPLNLTEIERYIVSVKLFGAIATTEGEASYDEAMGLAASVCDLMGLPLRETNLGIPPIIQKVKLWTGLGMRRMLKPLAGPNSDQGALELGHMRFSICLTRYLQATQQHRRMLCFLMDTTLVGLGSPVMAVKFASQANISGFLAYTTGSNYLSLSLYNDSVDSLNHINQNLVSAPMDYKSTVYDDLSNGLVSMVLLKVCRPYVFTDEDVQQAYCEVAKICVDTTRDFSTLAPAFCAIAILLAYGTKKMPPRLDEDLRQSLDATLNDDKASWGMACGCRFSCILFNEQNCAQKIRDEYQHCRLIFASTRFEMLNRMERATITTAALHGMVCLAGEIRDDIIDLAVSQPPLVDRNGGQAAANLTFKAGLQLEALWAIKTHLEKHDVDGTKLAYIKSTIAALVAALTKKRHTCMLPGVFEIQSKYITARASGKIAKIQKICKEALKKGVLFYYIHASLEVARLTRSTVALDEMLSVLAEHQIRHYARARVDVYNSNSNSG